MYVLVKNGHGEARAKGLRQALEFCGFKAHNKTVNYSLSQVKCPDHEDGLRGMFVEGLHSKLTIELDCCCERLKEGLSALIKSTLLAADDDKELTVR